MTVKSVWDPSHITETDGMICLGRDSKITQSFTLRGTCRAWSTGGKAGLRQEWECLCLSFGLWDASLQGCAERSHSFSYLLISTEGNRAKHRHRAIQCCRGETSSLWTCFTSAAPNKGVISLSPVTAQPSFETWHKCFETGREQQFLSTHLLPGTRTMCVTELTWCRLCLPTY